MEINDPYECLVANNAEELLGALEQKAPNILITKYYKEEFLENTEVPLPEDNLFSGTRIAAGVGGHPVFLLMNFFAKDDKHQRKIDTKIQQYIIKKHGEDLLLYLRSLDY